MLVTTNPLKNEKNLVFANSPIHCARHNYSLHFGEAGQWAGYSILESNIVKYFLAYFLDTVFLQVTISIARISRHNMYDIFYVEKLTNVPFLVNNLSSDKIKFV